MRTMKKYLFFAAAFVALASCSNDSFVGDNSPTMGGESGNGEAIVFASSSKGVTRGDIVGDAAATLLGNGFYVAGTKGSEGTNNPSETLVFDNYLVHHGTNTAGTTESNTANWEYVGITPGTAPYTNWVKLSSLNSQTIKYWDYSTAQYDFLAFSTGSKKAVSKNDLSTATVSTDDDVADGEIGVTAMKYGAGLASAATAYTLYVPTIDALKEAYITDVITVGKSNYGKEVQLTFKNLGSKIRLALYETVPGYSVQAGSVKFYTVDKSDADVISSTDLNSGTSATAALISANTTYGFPQKGKIEVSFPNVGTSNSSNANYKKASVSVTPYTVASTATYQTFGALASDKYATAEGYETSGSLYLGRSLPQATYAGVAAVDYYQVVFPITGANAAPLTLRVDYTLISTDGSGETINVYGAKAVVPATYTVWQPNYAYTYVFKISDNTNGWTTTAATADNQGLYPITFDAVVAEIKDVSGEQTTITTVATPTITTYQQNHDKSKNEYSIATGKDIYVQVMDNTSSPATLKGDLNGTTPTDGTARSLLYAVTSGKTYTTQPAGWPAGYYTDADCNTAASGSFSSSTTYYKRCAEAEVMDALQNRTTALTENDVTGRNGIILTKNSNITATGSDSKFDIVNGPDDKKITVTEGQAAKIAITAGGFAAGTYAYVYDYSDAAKTTKTFYQPNGLTTGQTIASGVKYITLTKLASITLTTTGSEAADDAYIYFSKTTTDGTNYTYSYYSVDGKTGYLPAGLLKVSKSTDLSLGDGSVTVSAGDFVFDIYTRNTGKYAVKVIKVVA